MVDNRIDDGTRWPERSAPYGMLRDKAYARWVLPALLGALMWVVPGESEAGERCKSKPAVCARLKAQRAARATPPLPEEATRVAAAPPRCATKPVVCARLAAIGARPAAPPVTLATNGGDRCTTKPAVCARLRMRPSSSPVTFAKTPAAPALVD